MAKAAIRVDALHFDAQGMVIDFKIVTDTGIDVSSASPLSLARSATPIISDLKALARQVILDVGGPNISDVDMTIFGGPN